MLVQVQLSEEAASAYYNIARSEQQHFGQEEWRTSQMLLTLASWALIFELE